MSLLSMNISYRKRKLVRDAIINLLTIIILLLIIFPLFWALSTSVRPRGEMFNLPISYLPRTFTLENYARMVIGTKFLTYYKNSFIISAGVVVLTSVISSLGGYGLTRIDMKYKESFARLVLFGYMFPPILLSIPMFIFWSEIGIIGSYTGAILAETALSLPFALWLMWKFFQTVPKSLEESARMAGASRFRAFYEIALPLAKPGVIAVAIFSYSISWNAYTIPKILLPDASKWPLTVGVFSFVQGYSVNWGIIMAACVLILLPSFIFVYSLQKYLLQGFSTGV